MPRPRAKPVYQFFEGEADRVVAFFERVLVHTEGIYAGKPFILTDWQKNEIVRPLFGWYRWDDQFGCWVRKYTKAWIEIPRGNGKSEIAAGVELQGLCADGEYGAEVYGGAEDKDQASIVFRVAAQMVKLSPILKKRLKVIESRKRIVDPRTNSFYQVLPRDRLGTGSQGFKLHRGVIDEVHVQTTKDFMDAVKRGMGKRLQPMLFMITTAGDDPDGPAAEEHAYAKKILSGEVDDPSYFVYIKEPPKEAEDDPFNEEYWYAVNPALGDFLSIETLRQEALEAKEKPSELNKFLQYRLNIWVRQHIRWLPMERWDATAGMVDELKLKGKRAYAGLHLTASTDIVAWVLDFADYSDSENPAHDALFRFWVPEARRRDLSRRTDGESEVWIREGFLKETSGDVIDYDAIMTQIDSDAKAFDIAEVGYHRWGMTQLSQKLEEEHLEVVPVSHGMAAMSPPTKAWEKLIYEKAYCHGGNPVMRWMISNVAVKQDSEGNIKIDSKASKDTVTGPIAAVMALDRAVRASNPTFEGWVVA